MAEVTDLDEHTMPMCTLYTLLAILSAMCKQVLLSMPLYELKEDSPTITVTPIWMEKFQTV